MITHKKCKGENKALGFGCSKIIDVKFRKYGLCISCYSNWLLNSDKGKEMIAKATLKSTKPRIDLERATKIHKEQIGLTTLIKSVVKVCHEYIRVRDKFKPCISCGASWNKNFQAGHFKKAEKFTTIKLNEYNINGQCTQCNLRKDGNESEYSIRLPDRIGEDSYKELVRLAELDHSIDFHWCRIKLKETRTYYNLKLKELKR
jgi:hypothetical protein